MVIVFLTRGNRCDPQLALASQLLEVIQIQFATQALAVCFVSHSYNGISLLWSLQFPYHPKPAHSTSWVTTVFPLEYLKQGWSPHLSFD